MFADRDICECCGGIQVRAPRASHNRSRLPAVSVRTGTYWSFRETMTARLTSSSYGALADLRSRDPAVDASIGLIDAWAVTGDILTFYTQWLANETLVETAQELGSLHLLARLIGYRPHPGVSAVADLAFTMNTAEGAPKALTLPSGLKVQSTPGPDEDPVVFETADAIPARPAWNAIRPRLGDAQSLTGTTSELLLAGTQTGLKPGDALYFTADDATPVFARIRSVTALPANPAEDPDAVALTRLEIEPNATAPLSLTLSEPPAPPLPDYPSSLSSVLGQTVSSAELSDLLADSGVREDDLFEPLAGAPVPPKRVLVFRQSAGIFGNTAPTLGSLPQALTGDTITYEVQGDGTVMPTGTIAGPYKGLTDADWADGTLEVLDTAANFVFLDKPVPHIAVGSHVALIDGDDWGLYQPFEVAEVSVAEFAMTSRSTRLAMTTDTGFSTLTTRRTTAYAASEWIDLPLRPRADALRAGDTVIPVEGWLPGLEPERSLVLTGRRADDVDADAVEIALIAEVAHDLSPGGGTALTLAAGLQNDFDRRALRMNANVARASHGESTEEILGSGGRLGPFPVFEAKQKPLTHLTAEVPGGAAPEVTLRINGIEWQRVPDLLGAGPGDRVYTLTLDPEGTARYGFGDGLTGAIPPAGEDNIALDYRTGLGLGGRVDAGQLDVLLSRPLGLEQVTNPLPADGGADPEPPAALRAAMPLHCRTLDRVVSLQDYADFALTYAGVAKARSERVKLPGRPAPGVVVTVAGDGAAPIPEGSEIYDGLRGALESNGIPFARFHLRDFRLRHFRVGAKILPAGDRIADDVLTAAEAALRATFDFATRAFAQPVFASEVIACLQDTDGVEAVILDRFYSGGVPERADHLIAGPATVTEGAELLILHPGPLDYLEVMQ